MTNHSDPKSSGFINMESIPAFEPAPGCQLKTPHGENLMLSQVTMKEGAIIPLHSHPHEQGGVLLEGQLELQIGEETRVIESGQMYLIPSNVPHRAVAVGGTAVVLDVFSPVREDYIEMSHRNSSAVNSSSIDPQEKKQADG